MYVVYAGGVCVNRRSEKHVNYPDILLLYILETGSLIKLGISLNVRKQQ